MQDLTNLPGSLSECLPEGEAGDSGETSSADLIAQLEAQTTAGWAKLYPKDIVKEANRVSLTQIFHQHHISFQTTYSPSGWIHKTNCPFPSHRDSSPSFFFNPTENIFKCFGCGKKGSTVLFLSFLQNREPEEVAIDLLQEEGLEKLEITQYENKMKLAAPVLMKAALEFRDYPVPLMEKITAHLDGFLRNSLKSQEFTLPMLEKRIKICNSLLKENCAS